MLASSGKGLREIEPPVGAPPRYSRLRLPRVRFVPGLHSRPAEVSSEAARRGACEPVLDPVRWWSSQSYLYGTDLYNCGYWWEAHETWEHLWLPLARESPPAHLLQGLIQLAAAHLKRHQSQSDGACGLVGRATSHLRSSIADRRPEECFMGLRVDLLIVSAEAYFAARHPCFPFCILAVPGFTAS